MLLKVNILDQKKDERFVIHNMKGIDKPVLTTIKNASDSKTVGMNYEISSYLLDNLKEFNGNFNSYCSGVSVSEQPIATISCHKSTKQYLGFRYFKVDDLWVDENYQRMGIGSEMLDVVEDLAMVNNIKNVYIDPYACAFSKFDPDCRGMNLLEKIKNFIDEKRASKTGFDSFRRSTENFARRNSYSVHNFEMPHRKLPSNRPLKIVPKDLFNDVVKGSVFGECIDTYTNETAKYLEQESF